MSVANQNWSQIKWYLDNGISVMPVRDHEEKINGDVFKIKTPFYLWKELQDRIINEEVLWKELERFNTSFVALVCGRVSGNLEVIDIDVKWKPGIDILILNDIKELMPDVYSKIRIHKTMSGGFHLLYRIIGMQVPPNSKLAGRELTDAEKSDPNLRNGNSSSNPVYFLETRGQGGYVVAPPSAGYNCTKCIDIPLITREERESIINICRNYHEIKHEIKPFKTTKKIDEIYDENPFAHFSRMGDAVELVQELGWKYIKQRGDYIWFTRPGKDSGVSGSFNTRTRIFWSWSSNTDFAQEKGYFLSQLLYEFKFLKDGKKTYKWLEEHGYGRIKPYIERQIVLKKAQTGDAPPANLSREAKKEYEIQKVKFNEQHPFGIFWEFDDKGRPSISRERLYYICANLGFRVYRERIVHIRNKFIFKLEKREFYDTIKNYIKIEDSKVYEDVANTYEQFIQHNGTFTMDRIELLDLDNVLLDTRTKCNKFYADCFVEITAKEIVIKQYSDLNKLVFHERIQDRPLNIKMGGRFLEFLAHAVRFTQRMDYVLKILGYLAHEYKDATTPYLIALTEEVEDPRAGGGTGKNIWCELLSFTTTFTNRPASQANLDERFFQSWGGEKVMAISDLPNKFNFEFFKELSSGSGTIKRLYENQRTETVDNLPKILFSTQFSFEISDGGLRRRIIPLEFTNHFNLSGGVDTFFGIQFPSKVSKGEWEVDDWAGYDWAIHEGIQLWLRSDLKLHSMRLSDTGWLKQFAQIYGEVCVAIIDEYWTTWVQKRFVTLDEFKINIESYYSNNSIPPMARPKSAKINKALVDYGLHCNIRYDKDVTIRGKDGLNWTRGKTFTPFDEAPF